MERKILDIYACGITKPTICLTYNLRVDNDIGENYADKVQCWIVKDKIFDPEILIVAQTLLRGILLASGNQLKIVKEKEIFIQYQRAFAKKQWNAIGVRTETFNTERLAIFKKPYRDFELVSKDIIDNRLQKIFTTKGE